ncbi:MAG: LPS export ABC transporter periplasmic protein LptC [Gammaproteobacteria bacterium]|nr:LPS export ABC transporter periplasmic protein LptC [Gammaproteobacteria bacterium]
MIRRRTRLGILLMSALAGLTWLLSRPTETDGEAPVAGIDTRLNYALHDFQGRLLDQQGETRLEISAPLLQNDAASGIGTVEKPDIRIQQDNEEWYITADSAVIASDREKITLAGQVNMLRRNAVTGARLDIVTRDVLLDVTPRTASTDADVRILQNRDRLDATGMRLDIINDRFELLSEVRAHYEVY